MWGVLSAAAAFTLLVFANEAGGLLGLPNSWWLLAMAVVLVGSAIRLRSQPARELAPVTVD